MSNDAEWPAKVVKHYEDVYADKDLRIIMMRDFGSRSKNMDGPDSDVDAMFLFDQPPMAHKRLGSYVDVIDPNGEVYGADVHGWNVRKFADLLEDSNPQAIEFLNSPITYNALYWEGSELYEEFDDLQLYANRNFNPIRLYYHFQSFAKKNYTKYHLKKLIHKESRVRYRIDEIAGGKYYCHSLDDGEEYVISGQDVGEDGAYRHTTTDRTIRRYLKVARSALHARHIRRTKSLPSMDFEHFLQHSVSPEIAEPALDLLEGKRRGLGNMATDGTLNDVIEYEINHKPNNDDLNRRGISRARVNQFIETVDGVLY